MEKLSFAALFFRIYDRKIASGEITFSQIGMNKSVFTELCQGGPVDITEEELAQICERMKLTAEENTELTEAFAAWKK